MSTEKFITLVKKYFYDSKIDEKHTAEDDSVQKAWMDIAIEMGEENDEFWKRQWNTMLQQYKNFKELGASSPIFANGECENWKWTKHLQFLNGYKLGTCGNIEISSNNPTTSIAVVNCETNNNLEDSKSNDHCRLFQGYANSFQNMPIGIQHSLRVDMDALFAKYETQILKSRQDQKLLPAVIAGKPATYQNNGLPTSFAMDQLRESCLSGWLLKNNELLLGDDIYYGIDLQVVAPVVFVRLKT